MILSHVHIRNYKQYVDAHDVGIPSAATVGIIGANGVGKTTLFEAIEWCLYSPSTIPNKDIRPRGRAGTTKVALTLEMPSTGKQFIVERELKRSSTQAVVYRIEQDGEQTILVQGARQVTEYVAQHLIGLSHKAFTATFFTRQKELHFFGDLGDTDRRREVGKLLGLETIRAAQQLIAEDRRRAGNEAQILRQQHERLSQGRDVPAEIAAVDGRISEATAALTAATASMEQATASVATAEQELATHQALKDRDGLAAQRILELRGSLAKADQSRQHHEADLARLAQREEERRSLEPVAARLDALREQVEAMEALREQDERKRALEQDLRNLAKRREEHVLTLRSTVTTICPPAPLRGWSWDEVTDPGAPDAACTRLVAAIATVDVSRAEYTESQLRTILATAKTRADELKMLDKFRTVRAGLDARAADLTKNGEPADRLRAIDARRQSLIAEQSEIGARQTQLRSRHQQASRLIADVQGQRFEDRCPTCGRPFAEHDAALVLEALETQLGEMDAECQQLGRRAQQVGAELETLASQRKVFDMAHADLENLRGRIAASVAVLKEQQDKVDALDQELGAALKRLGREQAPTDDDLTRATVELQTWRRIIDARPGIERISESIVSMTAEVGPLQEALRPLAGIAYDAAAHRQVQQEHQAATKAHAAIERIDAELARRPELERELATARQAIAATAAEIAVAERERAAIGFDDARLATAQSVVQEARAAERQALDARHAAEGALRDAGYARTSLLEEQERVAGLAARADQCQREHDTLDQMYREFTEFERYAAAWYAPKLSEITSELVSEVTDGKYDRVVFDNNFGIDIYDGDEEKFPLDTFSGGERDAIALCARIALSRVIGGQGTTPPGFLVLDEVFGSLDRDRRTRLLEMLGAITSHGESFRQVFIISHVDDVRTAPIFDELWQVVETSDGSSQLNVLPAGADIGEI